MRVFCIGPPKSGTCTINYALKKAGLFSSHGSVALDEPPLAIVLWRAFMEDRDPLFYVQRGVDAVTDPFLTRNGKYDNTSLWPSFCPAFLRSLRHHNPETLILMSTRDPRKWLSSIDRWKDLRARIVKSELPFLPAGRGKEDEEMIDWITGYYERTRAMLHNDLHFLEIDIEDEKAPQHIGKALNIKLPWWGKKNVNEGKTDAVAKSDDRGRNARSSDKR